LSEVNRFYLVFDTENAYTSGSSRVIASKTEIVYKLSLLNTAQHLNIDTCHAPKAD